MGKAKWVVIGGIGAIAGFYLVNKVIRPLSSPENALQKVKHIFKQKGLLVEGSWIYTTAENETIDDVERKVYYGGITANDAGTLKSYEFVSDATTGEVISIKNRK